MSFFRQDNPDPPPGIPPPSEASAASSAFDSRRRVLSVSELTARVKLVLEDGFAFVWVRGEVSNLRVPSSGHCYFTLKDEKAQIAAVMFRGQNRQLKFTPRDGMSVVGLGRISVYEPRGSYQIILEYLEPAGAGALQLAFEQLKRRLADGGFFDAHHKHPLPFLPRKISVITSPSGAVVHDVITVIGRRYPHVHLEIVPTRVQGTGSEEEIAAALELIAQRADTDVIILARGGGSLEDLQPFNTERVAMAIFNCPVPVVSAVGHETDFTIADFIADLRAPTPSAAAELVVPDRRQLVRRHGELAAGLARAARHCLSLRRKALADLEKRVRDPRRNIQQLWLRLDDIAARLHRLASAELRRAGQRHEWLRGRLRAGSPVRQVDLYQSKLHQFKHNLLKSNNIIISDRRAKLAAANGRLSALNPAAILERGYSIARTVPLGEILRDADVVSVGQQLEVRLARGSLLCVVKGKRSHGQENF